MDERKTLSRRQFLQASEFAALSVFAGTKPPASPTEAESPCISAEADLLSADDTLSLLFNQERMPALHTRTDQRMQSIYNAVRTIAPEPTVAATPESITMITDEAEFNRQAQNAYA
ncbi:MAG: hypothetical protein NUV98_06680, partial [Candidatus Roizmanbacteria bacterium]|nr:hypothetical protein [Candidatus Roizmanbacteria bacterium]